MKKGIVLDNCSNVLIDGNTFEGLDVAVEARESSNIRLSKNKISYLDSRIKQLFLEINNSNLPPPSKKELIERIIGVVLCGQKKALDVREKENLLTKVSNIFGRTAWDLLKAIISDVIAGKILIKFANLG